MKYFLFTVSLFVGFFVLSCNDSKKQTTVETRTDTSKALADTLMAEVMDGHDAGMAKYGKLNAQQNKVQSILDSIARLPLKAREAARPLKVRMDSLLVDIKSAKQGMDDWMDHFNMDSAVNDIGQRIRYLSAERSKVQKIKDDIFTVLQKTDSLIRERLQQKN